MNILKNISSSMEEEEEVKIRRIIALRKVMISSKTLVPLCYSYLLEQFNGSYKL